MVNGNRSLSSTTTEKIGGTTNSTDEKDYQIFPDLSNKNMKLNDNTIPRRNADGRFTYFFKAVSSNVTTITLKELKHFSAYTIHVKACREGEGENCSIETSTPVRTKKLGECSGEHCLVY